MQIKLAVSVSEDDGSPLYAPEPTIVKNVDDDGLAQFSADLQEFGNQCHKKMLKAIKDKKKKS